jgi:hypothetical protein
MTTPAEEAFSEKMTELLLDLIDGKATPNVAGYLNGGGAIWEEVAAHPGYYLFSSEKAIFESKGAQIAQDISNTQRVIVVGQGTALMDKEWHVISRLPNLQSIDLIDVSHIFNAHGLGSLRANKASLPSGVQFSTLSANFRDVACKPLREINPQGLITTVMCTGSLITNIDNPPKDSFPNEEIKSVLYALMRLAGGHGHVIVGFDTNDDLQKLDGAYKLNRANAKFHRNEVAYLLEQSRGIEFRTSNGGILIPKDRKILEELFIISTPDRFDHNTRNYYNDLKPSEPIFAHMDTKSRKEVKPIEPFRMKNCFKPSAAMTSRLAIEACANDPDFSVRAGFYQGNDGIVVQPFHITPKHP